MNKRLKSYQEDLLIALKDSQEATAYLNAALMEGDQQLFLLAISNVIEARKTGRLIIAKRN